MVRRVVSAVVVRQSRALRRLASLACATCAVAGCEPAAATLTLGSEPCVDGAVVERGDLATPELLFFVTRSDGAALTLDDIDVGLGEGSDAVCTPFPPTAGADGAVRVGVRFGGTGTCVVDVVPVVAGLEGRCTVRGSF